MTEDDEVPVIKVGDVRQAVERADHAEEHVPTIPTKNQPEAEPPLERD